MIRNPDYGSTLQHAPVGLNVIAATGREGVKVRSSYAPLPVFGCMAKEVRPCGERVSDSQAPYIAVNCLLGLAI